MAVHFRQLRPSSTSDPGGLDRLPEPLPAPYIQFNGIDLDMVAANIEKARTFGLSITAGDIGFMECIRASRDSPSSTSKLLEARFDFQLTMKGLVFSFSTLLNMSPLVAIVEPNWARGMMHFERCTRGPSDTSWIHGRLTLPREVLIIRSPLFMRHRKSLLKEKFTP